RGGAASSTPDELLTYVRKSAPPGGSSFGGLNLLGLRCVRPVQPGPASASQYDDLVSRDDLAEAAAFYAYQGRLDRVRECARRLLALNPRSVPGNFWRADEHRRAGRLPEALAALKLAYCQEPRFDANGLTV